MLNADAAGFVEGMMSESKGANNKIRMTADWFVGK